MSSLPAIHLRLAGPSDTDFLTGLSPRLSGVPGPAWHDLAAMEGFQERYMAATFAPAALEGAATLIAETVEGRRLGYIHMRPGKDGVTDEPCGYVSLLALAAEAEGTGVGRQLMAAAEAWVLNAISVSVWELVLNCIIRYNVRTAVCVLETIIVFRSRWT